MIEAPAHRHRHDIAAYVTVTVCSHLFGLPIARVQDVFVPQRLTRVPLAPIEVVGVLNLRGRIVTAIDMRRRLKFSNCDDIGSMIAVGVEVKGDSYGLLVDAVGEVVTLSDAELEPVPVRLDRGLAHVLTGVHRLEDRLLLILDIDRLIEFERETNGGLINSRALQRAGSTHGNGEVRAI
jgi:purine-binding chemotaxis protein CheW